MSGRRAFRMRVDAKIVNTGDYAYIRREVSALYGGMWRWLTSVFGATGAV